MIILNYLSLIKVVTLVVLLILALMAHLWFLALVFMLLLEAINDNDINAQILINPKD